jgi:putative oxidoreductase
MNWYEEKKGEGIEYFVMILAILLVSIVRGSGSLPIDLFMI